MARYIKLIFLIVMLLLYMLPVYYSIASSFKGLKEIYSYPPTVFPQNPSLQGYIEALRKQDMLTYLRNTLFVAVVATIITVMTSVMGGYGLAKGTFIGKITLNRLVVMTLFITAQVIMVPLFVIIRRLGLINNLWGLILPAVYTPTGMFTAIQYMRDIPDEFLESAKVDGASEWAIFWKIVFPLSKPLIAALSIFSFTWRWNDFVLPLLVVNKRSLYTLQLALAVIQGEFGGTPWNTILAFSTLTIIPTLVIFLLFQRFFMRGITAGGLKY
ncbi:MAG: Binding-protein-dependent transport systems inner membrane component [Thermotoga sp. 50_1627]|uniref:carbohydrate ABC transporter permease n=1 Tax=Pseudothermotoga sp. TaxID=2033661 RepID=UPI00076DD945|nr:MAG: Binding-protein-dependent transport systems inner membrane component [Thermotoga sp. 50_64]KUK25174.1 MAG: Binding-protein-dependent transport systems inner membrane component [Thermotoga sp. 50_1627]MBC7116870.1 carbohydrate ABC transporter permease [Pseudothermotoga sp.]MDK2923645.1 alpha,4-digalacturonate transport system permease protein [Pseudothermotoga sp.]HBT39373.1 sugar ABC transporter permease [Pseudothermotoga sp.]